MQRRRSKDAERPRELRRRVVVPARLRHGASWSDAHILNVSSRGLMIHSGRPIGQGTQVEIRRGDYVIVARVVWRDGGRAGLRAEDRVPVEAIMSLGRTETLLQAAPATERRKHGRSEDRSRLRGRTIEFAGVAVIAACLAGAGLIMVEALFAQPIALVSAAMTP